MNVLRKNIFAKLNFFVLFQGGFAKCYELRSVTSNEILAGKIVPKSLLVKQHQREKMAHEITLHQTLAHPYVVKLYNYFEDSNFVFIILELCKRRSLMELHKRRKDIFTLKNIEFFDPRKELEGHLCPGVNILGQVCNI